jgi:hypothetical protein
MPARIWPMLSDGQIRRRPGGVPLCVAVILACWLAVSCDSSAKPSGEDLSPVGPPTGTASPDTGLGMAASVAAVAGALRDIGLVALGESHGSAVEHAYFAGLLGDVQVQSLVDVIVVEFGAAPEQDVVDRYIDGADLTDVELRRIWTTTTQTSGVWDAPIYRQFFAMVRSLNAEHPDHRIRVVLGDPGGSAELCDNPDLATDAPCIDRDRFIAARAARELEAGLRVLIVAGVFHAWRTPGAGPEASMSSRLEADGHRAFVVLPFSGSVLRDPVVRARLQGLRPPAFITDDWLEAVPASSLRSGTITVECDQPPCETLASPGSLADVSDAYVYLGG